MLDPKFVHAVTRDIQKKFPEMSGVQPKVRTQTPPQGKSAANTTLKPPNYLLTFSKNVPTATGHTLPRWVRVVVNPQGKVLKITTSRG